MLMRVRRQDLQFTEFSSQSQKQDVFWNEKKVAIVHKVNIDSFTFRVDLLYFWDGFPEDIGSVQKAILVESYVKGVESILDWIKSPKMNICHISDSHSTFSRLPPDIELVVHSGDFLPNLTRGKVEIEIPFQTEWVLNRIETFQEWIGNRKFIFSAGNHDFIDLCDILQKHNIDAVNVTNKRYLYKDIRFYGFPYIPYIDGEWNYESSPEDMSRRIRNLKDEIETGIDILVAHCPPYGILDYHYVERIKKQIIIPDWSQRLGNTQLSNLFSYGLENVLSENKPKYLLCGHIHSHHGIAQEWGMTISNAATTVHTIQIEL